MKYQPHVTFSAQALVFHSLMNMLDRVKSGESDQFDYLPVLVFMAFSIEAYVNSIGARKIASWDDRERLPWKKKIEILHANVHASPNWDADPLQFATQIFGIRDRLAHGKPEAVAGPLCDDHHTAVSMLYVQHIKPTILDDLSRDSMLEHGRRLYKLLEYLGALYGLDTDDFASFSRSHVRRHGDSPAEVYNSFKPNPLRGSA